MAARIDVSYREAPVEALERIDETSVPDCGAAAIARLQAEADRRRRIREFYIWPIWLASCALLLGIAAFRRQPAILAVSFIVLRDVCFGFWLNSDRTRLLRLAIEELARTHGRGRAEREARLRASIIAWNADAGSCNASLRSVDLLSPCQSSRLRKDIHRLRDLRHSLIAEIGGLRSSDHAAV